MLFFAFLPLTSRHVRLPVSHPVTAVLTDSLFSLNEAHLSLVSGCT